MPKTTTKLQRPPLESADHGKDPTSDASKKTVKITSLKALQDMVFAPKTLLLTVKGQQMEMTVQPLSGELQTQADKIDAIIPPKKTVSTKEGPKEDFDYENPAYQEKVAAALRIKKTFLLLHGIPGFEIRGDTIEDQQKTLYAQLQTGVIDALVSAILQITRDPVEQAVFI